MKFRRIEWDFCAQQMLWRSLQDDTDIIKREVEKGVSRLWKVSHPDGKTSHFVTRVEGRELVLVAYEGHEILATSHVIYNAAKAQGFSSIRIHVKQLALLKILRELKPDIVEYVVRFTLTETRSGTEKIHGRQIKHAITTDNFDNECTRH